MAMAAHPKRAGETLPLNRRPATTSSLPRTGITWATMT